MQKTNRTPPVDFFASDPVNAPMPAVELMYRSTVDALDDALHVVDRDLRITLHNTSCLTWCRAFGLRGPITGRHVFDLFPFLPEHVRREYDQVFSLGKVLATEETLTIDGRQVTTETRKIPIESDGRVNHVVTVMRNVTECRQYLTELQRTKEFLENVISCCTDGIAITDERGLIVHANDAFARMHDYTPDQLHGMHLAEHCMATPGAYPTTMGTTVTIDEAAISALFDEINAQNDCTNGWVHHQGYRSRRDGTLFPSEITLSRICADTGEQIATVAILRDTTARCLAEQKLNSLNQELEDRVRQRTAEIQEANIALKVLLAKRENDRHDLKELITLNIRELILPYLEKLRDSNPTPTQSNYLEILGHNLQEITAPFLHHLSVHFRQLTPMEIKIAQSIREGKTTKEIAESMHLSKRTIDAYRIKIRRKLGLSKKKANLRTSLQKINQNNAYFS